MTLLQIENAAGYLRDVNSKAILNTNKKDATDYNTKARILRDQKDHALKLEKIESDIEILSHEIRELKEMLKSKGPCK